MRFRSAQQLWFGIQVACICLMWYGSSSAQSIVNKYTLQRYPYPLTVALSSLLNNVLCAIPLIRLLHITQVKLPSSYLMRTVVPISVGRALAVSSAYFSLWRVPVSYAQTVKSTMPIFTVLITRLMLNEHHSKRVYASLLPIIVGVFTASATELQFDSFGLAASLFSTSVFAFLNVLAKKVFNETGMHPTVLLSLNSQLASLMLFPVWLVSDGYGMWSDLAALNGRDNTAMLAVAVDGRPDFLFLALLFTSGVLSFVQNMCAFVLIHQLTTLSYSVSNAAKRVFVIFLSLVMFRNPVTPLNICGMALSILGVFAYNRVKAAENAREAITHHEKMNGDMRRTPPSLFRRKLQDHIFDAGGLRSSDSDVRLMLSTD